MFGPETLPLLENDLPTIISSWSNHYKSWKKFKKNYLLIKYENLLNKPQIEFLKIANFLKKTINLKVDQSKIDVVIKNTQFKKFKDQEDNGGFKESAKNKNNENLNFFYLGPENDWRKYLDDNTKNSIENTFKDEMRELGYL